MIFGWEELSTCTMEYNEQNIVNYFDICTELLSILIWKIEVNEFYLFIYLFIAFDILTKFWIVIAQIAH